MTTMASVQATKSTIARQMSAMASMVGSESPVVAARPTPTALVATQEPLDAMLEYRAFSSLELSSRLLLARFKK